MGKSCGGTRCSGPELDGRESCGGERFLFFSRDSESAFGSESAIRKRFILDYGFRWGKVVASDQVFGARGGSFWTMELDGEKLWRRQVFGARMREKNGRKLSLFSRDNKRSQFAHRKCDQGRLVLDQN